MNVLIPSVGRKRYLVRMFLAALQSSGGRLFVSDVDGNAPALSEGGERVVLPRFDDATYWSVATGLIEARGIDAVLPVRDAELVGWAERGETGGLGAVVCLSPSSTLRICTDKSRLYAEAARGGVRSPRTWQQVEWHRLMQDWPGTLVAKPITGSGSRGLRILRDAPDLAEARHGLQGYLVQERVAGPEFSVDCFFAGRGGRPMQCLARQRLEVEDGECVRARIVQRADLESLVQRLAEALSFQGVVNFQFIDSEQGPLLIDVNPRFPGGLKISVAHGFSAVSDTLALLENGSGFGAGSQGAR